MLTIEPRPLAVIAGSTAAHSSSGARTLTASIQSMSSAVSVWESLRRPTPALLTRMSRPPSASSAAAPSATGPSGEARSAVSTTGSCWSSPARSARASAVRADTATRAPARSSATAQARPMPRLAPVTSAVRPVRSKGSMPTNVRARLPGPPRSAPSPGSPRPRTAGTASPSPDVPRTGSPAAVSRFLPAQAGVPRRGRRPTEVLPLRAASRPLRQELPGVAAA